MFVSSHCLRDIENEGRKEKPSKTTTTTKRSGYKQTENEKSHPEAVLPNPIRKCLVFGFDEDLWFSYDPKPLNRFDRVIIPTTKTINKQHSKH